MDVYQGAFGSEQAERLLWRAGFGPRQGEAESLAAAGLDGGRILERAQSEAIKDRLRANTDEVMARGGFGSPTIFVGGSDMYFGNDRLPLVRAALERARV